MWRRTYGLNTLFFEPCYTSWRIIPSKLLVLVSVTDDTFDAYGTPQEHQLFIDLLRRWEIGALDELLGYTKVIYKAVLDVFDEIDDEARKQGRSNFVPYARDLFMELVNGYQWETKWYHDGYIPTFEEYMTVSQKTTSNEIFIATSFIGNGASVEAFEWQRTDPKIMKATNFIGRLMDNIVSRKFERFREQSPSSIECYMNQHNLSEKDTLKDFEKKLEDAWKDVNEDCMRPTAIPRYLLSRPLNFDRAPYVFYKTGDGYTHPEYVKDDIRAMFFDPITI
ncbi:hypothetical protein CRYUN_Cryun39dG0073000 [Craigia yunnanensis]